jgi:plasmid segregation protein ParM
MQNIAAVDLGNAIFQAIINGKEYTMPNVIAPCEEEVSYYDESQLGLFDNMVVEVDSASLNRNKANYFIGISASTKTNQLPTSSNNQKTSEDRTMVLLLSMLAYHFTKENPEQTTFDIDFDLVATALPTRQVKKNREDLKKKITGHHTVTFKYVPNSQDIEVKINIKESVVGIEGNLAFLALTRDLETLKVKDESLLKETILIADLGGDSYDPAGFKDGKLIDDSTIKGEPFGINEFLDKIIVDIADNTGYIFQSRHSLEQLLIKGASEWVVTVDQEDVNVSQYIVPHFKVMADKFLNLIDRSRKNTLLQGVKRIYPIGGPVLVAKHIIKEVNNERQKPLKLELDVDNVEKLNLTGLWILAQATMKSKKQTVSSVKE